MTYSLIDRLADLGTPTAEEAIAEITRLTSALAASEEARRAERAAVVRECAEIAEDHTPRKHSGALASHITGKTITSAILALATDADNAALDKLLREARKVKKLEWGDYSVSNGKRQMAHAVTSIIEYRITQKFFPEAFFSIEVGEEAFLSAETLEAAKAAAQADYEARILAALEAPQ